MENHITIKPALAEKFKTAMRQSRVIFFSAPCGFGKSTTAEYLLSGRKISRVDAGQQPLALPDPGDRWEILLLDHFQQLQDEPDQQALCELIRNYPDRRFVLLSRGVAPGWLLPFQIAGLMTTFNTKDFQLDRDTTAALMASYGISPENLDLTAIHRETMGYPVAVIIVARAMADGRPYSPDLDSDVRRTLFYYFEDSIYRRFPLAIRRFLLELCPFGTLDADLARIVSGDNNAGKLLATLQSTTTMFLYDDLTHFHFWEVFQQFLQWELSREYTPAQQKALYNRGGLYYELREDYKNALECYAKGDDHKKISDLLIKNAQNHPSTGHYLEMSQYYHALPEEEVLQNPTLMQGMSILCALELDFDASERWYQALKSFMQSCTRSDPTYKEARSLLAWLEIALPQRSVEKLPDLLLSYFQLISSRELSLPPFSVTSMMPSLMNGGKDFSAWSKRDDLLYSTIGRALTAVLGKDGVGLADCAIAESKFEKGEDVTNRMLALMSQLGEIQNRGTPDIELAVVGLLVRQQVDAGQAVNAQVTMEALRRRLEDQGNSRFLPNMDAMDCRIALHLGDLDRASTWYRDKAPKDPVHLQVMRRYQYITEAMCELALGDPNAALLTLSPLETYFTTCNRHIDTIHLQLLTAIARYRQKNPQWKKHLSAGLDIAFEFRFIRPVSLYGTAVLPLLEECSWKRDEAFLRSLITAARMQAAYYPNYLQPQLSPSQSLTAMELQVLRLICADKSNAEIGEILGIKLPTVKTHVSHVLSKLGVSRRSEARTAAQRLWLLP